VAAEPVGLESKGAVKPLGGRRGAAAGGDGPEDLTGLQRWGWEAPAGLDGWAMAREIAGVLGCRPQEAGNAPAVLVAGELVDRQAGDGTPKRPTRDRMRPLRTWQ
jgi:hypothetical protein